jgi:Flp pilus assembly protein TadD
MSFSPYQDDDRSQDAGTDDLDDDLVDRANRLLETGHPAEATTLLDAHLARQRDDPAALRALATALSQLGRHDQALNVAGRLAAAAPDWPEAHMTVAQTASAANQGALAVQAASRAAELAPEDWRAVSLYAEARLTHATEVWDGGALLHQLANTMEWAERAAELAPDRPETQMILGHAYMRHGQPKRAAAAFARALALDPTNEAADAYRAVSLINHSRSGAGLNASLALSSSHPADRGYRVMALAAAVRAVHRIEWVGLQALILVWVVGLILTRLRLPLILAFPWPNILVGGVALASWARLGWSLRGLLSPAGRSVLELARQSKAVMVYGALVLGAQLALTLAACLPYYPTTYGAGLTIAAPMRMALVFAYLPLLLLAALASIAVNRFIYRLRTAL